MPKATPTPLQQVEQSVRALFTPLRGHGNLFMGMVQSLSLSLAPQIVIALGSALPTDLQAILAILLPLLANLFPAGSIESVIINMIITDLGLANPAPAS